MAASILSVIQFDDCESNTESGFCDGSSVWDLTEDFGLFGCKDYRFISAISGFRSQSNSGVMFPLRGLPMELLEAIRAKFEGHETQSGWLNLDEIIEALQHQSVAMTELSPPVRNVLSAMRLLSSEYCGTRVRLIFAILD